MNQPLVPVIVIRIWRYKTLYRADAFDETKQFRGDVISYRRDEIDQFVENWRGKTACLTVEDTTLVATQHGKAEPAAA